MSVQGSIHRYSLIIEKLENNQFPSKKEIHEFLFDQGFENHMRTTDRAIEELRYEFGVEIIYDSYKEGYFIDKEKSDNFQSLLNLIEISVTAEVFGEAVKENQNKHLEYISFENQGSLKGINQLKPILKAIKEHRKIGFSHYNFHSGKTKNYSLKPYLLKEYQSRWYVVGLIGPLEDFRTFGIDRIENLMVKTDTFTPIADLDPLDSFRHIIGLTYSLGKREKVILSFTPTQGKYIKSLPLHSSQKELIDNEEEYRIELDIIPNFEFQQQVLLHGETVKVLEPESLVQEIKHRLKNAYEKYK